jgi:hypothetical protein
MLNVFFCGLLAEGTMLRQANGLRCIPFATRNVFAFCSVFAFYSEFVLAVRGGSAQQRDAGINTFIISEHHDSGVTSDCTVGAYMWIRST